MLNKFPSFENLYTGAVSTLRRFPLALLCAIAGTITAMIMIGMDKPEHEFVMQKIIIISALGLPLFFALATCGERRRWSPGAAALAQALGLIALIGYYFTQPTNMFEPEKYILRFLLLNIGLHFLVAFLPFTGKGKVDAFWQYNKSLFLRFLMAALYSSVMYIGLAIALGAADYLFGIEVKPQRYAQLWCLIAGIFNTWVFLAGVPEKLAELKGVTDYPRGLKVFTQYILLPLVGLYFVILFAYEAKIIVTWNWPKGWVSHLVLWYSVIGILSNLLLYPLKDIAGSRWIQVFSKWFYRALIPLVAMLILAILRRVSEYGITENRYFVMALAAGLAFVVIYFVVSKARDIRAIPITLCVLAFLSAGGPWGAFAVSRSSQLSRLEPLLTANTILVDGKIHKTTGKISFDDRQEISSIVEYLVSMHGLTPFEKWLPEEAYTELDTLSRYSQASHITGLMGFKIVNRWDGHNANYFYHVQVRPDNVLSISGYNVLLDFSKSGFDYGDNRFGIPGDSCTVAFDKETCIISLSVDKFPDTLTFAPYDSLAAIARTYDEGFAPADAMTFDGYNDSFRARLKLTSMSGQFNEFDSLAIDNVCGQLLIKLPE